MDLMKLMPGKVVTIGDIQDKDLSFLSGKTGVITQVLNSPIRKNRGYIVRVVGIPGGEECDDEWFIDTKYVKPKQ